MKNLQFFLMFFMMVIVGQQEAIALQGKSMTNNSTFTIDCGDPDCSCPDTTDED